MAGDKELPLENLKLTICSVNFTKKKKENNTVHLKNIKYTHVLVESDFCFNMVN